MRNSSKFTKRWLSVLCGLALISLLYGCENSSRPKKAPPPSLAKELVFYNWVDDMPKSVLDAFTKEYGVKVNYVTFESQEEAVDNILKGNVYDVAVLENPFIPALISANRLAEIDFDHVPNFKNISANFRDLAIDPGNRYTAPYHYGTTGLLVRTDLIGHGVTSWNDLWDSRYAGKVALRLQQRELIGMTLLSLGYKLNSEKPEEVNAAVDRLIDLKQSVKWIEVDTPKAVARILSGEAVIMLGWPLDYQEAHGANPAVSYVLPKEGTALWSDNYVIPASSPNAYTAAIFINFLLRPEISAQIVNEKNYPTANEAAIPLVHPAVRNDPVIFPTAEELRQAHFFLPIQMAAGSLYHKAWERFLAAPPRQQGD
ncbi:MAG: spermidine/putrescine ABC transporter substrate-binding protein [Desulforhopalus sp.]|nr:spermidine/putrescine ABC transporter substrate-binding protein [Desulforhopalus sp.]